jgi:hypothetical protein
VNNCQSWGVFDDSLPAITAGYEDKSLLPWSSERFTGEQRKAVTKFSPFGVCRKGQKSTWTLAGRSWGFDGFDNEDCHLAACDAALCVRNFQTFFQDVVKFIFPYTTSHLRRWQSTSVSVTFIFAFFKAPQIQKQYFLLYSNIYPTRCNVTQFILSGNCSACFRWYHHPSSGAQTTVSTASGICHTVSATCRYSCCRPVSLDSWN